MAKIQSTINIPVAVASDGGALQGFVWNQIIRGHKVDFGADIVVLRGLNANVQPTFSELVTIVSAGGSFRGIKLGIQFASVTSANRDVPDVVRGSKYIDDQEVEQTRTWLEWIRANPSIQIIRHTSGSPYVIKAVYNTELLNSEELAAAHAQAGITVIEWADIVSRFQSEDYEVFEI